MVKENKFNADTGEFVESGKWNAAKSYTDFMIFKPLHDAAVYEQVAKFGSIEIAEQLSFTESVNTKIRLAALNRVLFILRQVIINSKFALKDKDKYHIEKPGRDLDTIEKKYIPEVSERRTIGDEKKLVINEKKFSLVLNSLQKIRGRMSEYFNNADLIYYTKEADLTEDERDAWIREQMINRG